MVNTILKEADLFCPNSVRINFTIYHSKSESKNFLDKVYGKSIVPTAICR
ncbi:ABC transporter ATP-binding protein [Lactiplantibacillus plantarum]|nr:ABC transporter ATP-binding protein [Lactiplantibacillus plantarum]